MMAKALAVAALCAVAAAQAPHEPWRPVPLRTPGAMKAWAAKQQGKRAPAPSVEVHIDDQPFRVSAPAPIAPSLTLAKSGLHDPIGSVQGLVTRLLGAQYVAAFTFEVIPVDPSGNDVFELDASGGKPVIRGSAGYALASGLNWYLKYTANCSVSWGRNGSGNQVKLSAPGSLPLPAQARMVAPVKYRYSYNVCTYGYSMAWWNFTLFEQEIDRLALWGVNLPLAFQGQEYTWDRFYRSISSPLNETEINAFFAGPAFLPWERMGNMQGWGGPLNPSWHAQQKALQTAIVTRMREYGMIPVLPGFAGHVPRALKTHYPNASFTDTADWCGFPPQYGSDTLLEPTDPLFIQLGSQFHSMMLEDYGDPTGQEHPVFNADMYNEMEPNSGDLTYLKQCNAATYQAMTNANPNAVYMMQAWLFHEDFWTYDRVQAYLSGVPIGKLLILDLNSEAGPVWNQYSDFFGHTWIWNSLITYGGRRGIYGNLDRLALGPYQDHANASNMVGVGFTPEATEMIPSQFDIGMEAGWRSTPPDPDQWLQDWAVRRYGGFSPSLSQAHTILAQAAYNSPIDTASMEGYPSVGESMSRNTNASGLLAALQLYIAAAVNKEVDAATGTFSYDLTDLHRQVLIDLWSDVHGLLAGRFARVRPGGLNITTSIQALTDACSNILQTLDTALAADQNFLLGTWIADAAQWGAGDPDTTALWVYNARNQITLWGPDGEINDYAAKNGWAGLVQSYYLGRWSILFSAMVTSAATNATPIDQSALDASISAFEQAWGKNTDERPPTTASGADPVALAQSTVSTFTGWTPSAWKALPNTDVSQPAKSKTFIQVGQPGYAAVSSDCPFIADGDGSNLAACEASCIANSQCTAINWNAGGGNCIFRQCSDPLHPVLSPGYGGWVTYGLNMTSGPLLYNAWHTDAGVLATLCNLDVPGCAGFTSSGNLYSTASVLVAAPGVTLYVRQ